MFLINRMIRNSLIVNLFLTVFAFEVYADEVIIIPEHDSNFVQPSAVGGFYFTAPVDFTITGIDVPIDAGTSPFDASIYRHKNVTTYPLYMPLSDIETLADFSDQSTAVNGLNIAVSQGEIIGVVGRRGIITSYTTSTNNTFDSYIGEHLVTFTRLDIDNYQTTTPNISTDSRLPSGRIFLTYSMAEPEAAKKKAPAKEAATTDKQAAIDDAFSMTVEEVRAEIKKVAEKEIVEPIIVLNHVTQNNNYILNKKDPMIYGTINYSFVPRGPVPLDDKKIIFNINTDANNINIGKPVNNKNGLISLEVVELSKVKLQLNDINKEVKLSTVKLQLNEINQKINEDDDTLEYMNILLKYVIKINPKKMKTINCQGITRTTYSSNQSLTIGSAKYNKLLTGEVCDVIPLYIYNLVNEVTNYAYGGKSPFKKRETRDQATKSYEDLLNIIDDKNKDKAMAMSADQVKQILIQQRKTQAGSKDNSGGSAAGGATDGHHEEDHHHEEGHHEEAY